MKNKITTLPALAVGQVYHETNPGLPGVNKIEVLWFDELSVRYSASQGRMSVYKSARNRFEGLVKAGVFVLHSAPVKPVSREVELAHELDKAHQENQILRDRVARVRRDLLALLKSL